MAQMLAAAVRHDTAPGRRGALVLELVSFCPAT
jgi:hypothetical protein